MTSISSMRQLDLLGIEDIIRLPYFHSLEKEICNPKEGYGDNKYWKITFRCHRIVANGQWQLLDTLSDKEYITKYKLVEFKS
jgi:hypothetical protein